MFLLLPPQLNFMANISHTIDAQCRINLEIMFSVLCFFWHELSCCSLCLYKFVRICLCQQRLVCLMFCLPTHYDTRYVFVLVAIPVMRALVFSRAVAFLGSLVATAK